VSASRRVLAAVALAELALRPVPAVAGDGAVRSLLEIRRQHVVVQQWDTSCGAAALATVLTYAHQDPMAEKVVAQGMLSRTDPLRVRVRGGFSLLDMKRFAESRGYTAAGYRNLSVDQLLQMRSPIVPIEEYGNPHFVVLRGIIGRELDIADPAFGNRRMPVERFREVWKDGIGFVVTRPPS
jgi:predicted double-glycine peptidase